MPVAHKIDSTLARQLGARARRPPPHDTAARCVGAGAACAGTGVRRRRRAQRRASGSRGRRRRRARRSSARGRPSTSAPRARWTWSSWRRRPTLAAWLAAPRGYAVVDASTDADLDAFGRHVAAPGGAAGRHIGGDRGRRRQVAPAHVVRRISGPALVVCGSANPVARAPARGRSPAAVRRSPRMRRSALQRARSTPGRDPRDAGAERSGRRRAGGRRGGPARGEVAEVAAKAAGLAVIVVIGGDTAAVVLGAAPVRVLGLGRAGHGVARVAAVPRAGDHPCRRVRRRARPRRPVVGHTAVMRSGPMAITMGDASGVGPGDRAAARRRGRAASTATTVVYGDVAILAHGCELLGLSVPIAAIESPADVRAGDAVRRRRRAACRRPITARASSTPPRAQRHAPTSPPRPTPRWPARSPGSSRCR